jgi:sialidase-1
MHNTHLRTCCERVTNSKMQTQIMAAAFAIAGIQCMSCSVVAEDELSPSIYRHFTVEEAEGRVVSTKPMPEREAPLWAREVAQSAADWPRTPDADRAKPFFRMPIPFVLPPADADEPFHPHNHQPSITWLPNGDLLSIWYSTRDESGTELTVLASRLRAGRLAWDPSSEFFKASNRNMHGSSIFHDRQGTIYHFNGMGPDGGRGWANLALLLRSSRDNGVTWTPPRAIGPQIKGRHQVISGTLMTKAGVLIQNCDAVPGGNGGTALHLSHDGGITWTDPGADKPAPQFIQGGTGEGTIAGIHAQVVELNDGRLMALGRGDTIQGRMPMSISRDLGKTWTYHASPFPPIGGGQRLVLKRLQEGPLLFVSFTSGNRRAPESNGMTFTDQDGRQFVGHGMFAALSLDDGETWPVRKLLTPGAGEFNGGAHTGTFTATPTRAEHAGYLAATQTPDGVIHLISSRLQYRFNLAWLTAGGTRSPGEGELEAFLGEPKLELQQLFKDERFPNVVVARDGTVLATWGSRSIRVRRSEDGGQTWGPVLPVGSGIHGGGAILDEVNGHIWLFVEGGHPPAPLTAYRSQDHGRSWEAQEVVVHPDSHGNVPSMHMNERGITLRHGPSAGRLLRPTRSYAGGNHRSEWPNHYSNAIYSDDRGRTWHTSAPFPARGTGEAALAELSGGRIYYNSRRHLSTDGLDPRRRHIAWSDDGGETWGALSVSKALPDGDQNRDYGLMAGLVRLPVAGRDILIFSNIDSQEGRRRGTVWASFDGGKTWPVKRLIEEGSFAYSSLAVGRPGTPSEGWIYLQFEGEGGQMARFNLSWVLGGEPTGDGDLWTPWCESSGIISLDSR